MNGEKLQCEAVAEVELWNLGCRNEQAQTKGEGDRGPQSGACGGTPITALHCTVLYPRDTRYETAAWLHTQTHAPMRQTD